MGTKGYILLFSAILFLGSCSGVKKTQENINRGNYGSAIENALKNIVENKSKKSNQEYIRLLEEAYQKNVDRELQHIAFLKKDDNPNNLEAIFMGYTQLKSIQERIRPLLPLRLQDQGRDAVFVFKDYDNQIIKSKSQFSEHLYQKGLGLLQHGKEKEDFRASYDTFLYLEEVNPNFKNSNSLIAEAYQKGIDYVQVVLFNDTEQIIPARLEEELLNFKAYELNELWTIYHEQAQKDIVYDYEMQLAFVEIIPSPEKITEKQVIQEKQIKDGYVYAVDRRGEALKDSTGNKIKIDKFKTVSCKLYQFSQFKKVQVTGNVVFTDLRSHENLNSYPLFSEFVFHHEYARSEGDIRALEENLLPLLKLKKMPFPTNEQMVYDAGEDIKEQLITILKRHRFR